MESVPHFKESQFHMIPLGQIVIFLIYQRYRFCKVLEDIEFDQQFCGNGQYKDPYNVNRIDRTILEVVEDETFVIMLYVLTTKLQKRERTFRLNDVPILNFIYKYLYIYRIKCPLWMDETEIKLHTFLCVQSYNLKLALLLFRVCHPFY